MSHVKFTRCHPGSLACCPGFREALSLGNEVRTQGQYQTIGSICIWGEHPIAKNGGRAEHPADELMAMASDIRKVAFLGDYLPRKCGIATFTSDLLSAVATEHPAAECFAVPVNDIKGGYEYPAVVRFEVEEQDVTSYQRAADFLNIGNADI